jgi:hypothetical protein
MTPLTSVRLESARGLRKSVYMVMNLPILISLHVVSLPKIEGQQPTKQKYKRHFTKSPAI